MKLTIGDRTIEITSAKPCRHARYGVYLEIVIPKNNITAADVETLFTNNTKSIIVSDDTGDITYNGYGELATYSFDSNGYRITQLCASETQHQINVLNNKLSEQASKATQTINRLTELEECNTRMGDVLNNHSEHLEVQSEQMSKLSEMNAMQMASMDALLLEALPAIVSDAVMSALTNISNNVDLTEKEGE